MTRRQWLTVAGVGVMSAAYPTLVETRWLDVSSTTVKLPGMQSTERPVRLLHLADLHASRSVPQSMIRHAFALGLKQKPDLLCLTGDFITNTHGFDPDEYVETLRTCVRQSRVPVFAVLGNHDGGAWSVKHRGHLDHSLVEKILSRSEIHLLHNRAVTFAVRDQRFNLVGLADLWSGEMRVDTAFANTQAAMPTIVLAHNPDSKDSIRGAPWDLLLSGHTHGGQVLIPFEGPRFAPVFDKRYVAGLKSWGDRQIYVTRGVGNLGSVRFRCRPEVSLLKLS